MSLKSLGFAEYTSLFIGGEWVSHADTARRELRSASTLEPIGVVPESTPADLDTAVAAARAAFDDPHGWSTWSPEQRAEVLERLAGELDARKEETSLRVSAQNGMPYSTAIGFEGIVPAGILQYYSALIREAPDHEKRDAILGGTTLVRRIPLGVIGAIVPWNFPQAVAFFKLGPALAAGNTIVLKPSSETVLDSYTLAEAAIAAGLPAGVLNIVPGGAEIGRQLVQHPGIDKISFTGSTAVGREVAARGGELLRPVTVELGGKSAAIILDDADLSGDPTQLFISSFLNNGQTCFASTRILAPRSRYDEVVGLYEALAKGAIVGDALDTDTQVGPLVSERQRQRVESYIEKGKAEATLVAGGSPALQDRGWFVLPTVFSDVQNSSVIAQEEIFGPVLTITPYGDADEAVRIANDSTYGLGGTVWSTDIERATAVATRVRTGTIGINHYLPDLGSPYGGMKASGLGRELGPEGLASYQETQSVFL